MNLTVRCDGSYRTFELVGNLPDALTGAHKNPRSLNYAGAWNAAVDFLVMNRFLLDLRLITLQFSSLGHIITLEQFLAAGGFDEALDTTDECVLDFWLRHYEVQGEKERYEVQMKTILASPMSPILAMKMKIRQGDLPWEEDIATPPSPTAPTSRSLPQARQLTLCVTFGDVHLADQFFQSYIKHVPQGVEIHLVACLYRIASHELEALITQRQCTFHSKKILPESWGNEQGSQGKIGPWYHKTEHQHGVSWGRSVLHRAASLYSQTEAMWILDDDVLFDENSFASAFHQIEKLKQDGCKVGIGAILGDAPIPPSYMVRTQTIDFFYSRFLKHYASSFTPLQDFQFHDMHHDLSTEATHHLEFPIGVGTVVTSPTFDGSVLQGRSLTRSVHCEWKEQGSLLARGGNTLVIGREVLEHFPNMAPMIGGIMCRRGDTLWARRIQSEHPGWIRNVHVSLIQRRQNSFDFGRVDTVRGDMLGSMLVRHHGHPQQTIHNLLESVFNREARLICNLKRTLALLCLLHVEQETQLPLVRLLEQTELTPWPENLSEELEHFINTYSRDANKFKQAQGV